MLKTMQQFYTREEYLALEEQAEIKHEFFQGEIFAMAGGTFNHAKISLNIVVSLSNQLRGKNCTPMNSDMRVHTPSGLDTYPDISIYCGKPELSDKQHSLLNPVIIIEVLSPSTRSYDRGDKFVLYRALPSLRDYVLVDSERMFVEHFRRTDANEWILHEYQDSTETLHFSVLEETLSLASIYESIEFDVSES